MQPASVVVGIPTFRRPHQLATLLTSLEGELDPDVLVIVGDNDPGPQVPPVVDRSSLSAVYEPVPEPGIAQVRNALIRAATRHRPEWTHLIMLDDDGVVTPGWFAHLQAAVVRDDADVTGGPVLGDLPHDASLLARNSVFAGRARFPSGPVDLLTGAQNITISRRIVDRLGDPWFPLELGRSGGEDYYFHSAVLDAGGHLAWCDEAEVVEPTPRSRLTARALVRRAFHSNVVGAQVDRRFHGSTYVARRLIGGVGWTLRNTAAGVVRRDADRLARTALDAVGVSGRTVGLLRRRSSRTAHRSL